VVRHRVRLLALPVAGLLCFYGSALADEISGSDNTNCPGNDCFGTVDLLQYLTTPDSTTATLQSFDVTLTLVPKSMSGAGRSLAAEAVSVASSVTAGLGSGLSACDSTGNGFVCAENLATPLTASDDTNAWGSDVTVPTATLFTGSLQARVDGLYQDAGFDQNGITSEEATRPSITKPGWLLFFCAGLLGLAAYKLRRRRQRW